jgi:intracellular sulfur oxidation DsrE/DsrF family protein
MHVAAGVPQKDVQIVVIVHGPGAMDLLKPEIYAARNEGKANGSLDAVRKLLGAGVEFYLCGQTAMGQKITKLRPVGGFCAETGGALTLLVASCRGAFKT